MKSFRSILKDLLRQSKLNRINLLEKLLKLEKKKEIWSTIVSKKSPTIYIVTNHFIHENCN